MLPLKKLLEQKNHFFSNRNFLRGVLENSSKNTTMKEYLENINSVVTLTGSSHHLEKNYVIHTRNLCITERSNGPQR
jgi:hypothetical protein